MRGIAGEPSKPRILPRNDPKPGFSRGLGTFRNTRVPRRGQGNLSVPIKLGQVALFHQLRITVVLSVDRYLSIQHQHPGTGLARLDHKTRSQIGDLPLRRIHDKANSLRRHHQLHLPLVQMNPHRAFQFRAEWSRG